jgi:hypothetical protein
MKNNIELLLAASLIMTASEASAKPISVISIGNIPSYSLTPSIQWIEMFPANSRMCIESEPITFKGGKFLQLLLEGQKAYTPLPVNRQIFTPNPAGDPDCNKLAASLANPQQSSQVATNPTSVSPDTANYQAPDNTKPQVLETAISDPSMLADIAEINKGDPSFLKGRDPRLPSTEVSIGDLFYGRRSITPGGVFPHYYDHTVQKVTHWGSDKSSQDFVEASRWYQEAKTRLLAFNPALSAPQTASCIYPRRPPAYTAPGAQFFYTGSSNCNGYDDFVHAWKMEGSADNQLSSNGVALRQQAKQEDAKAKAAKGNLAQNVPKCDDQKYFTQLYSTVAKSPSGLAGGLRMSGISQIEEASDADTATIRVCYAMGAFNDGKKLIRYTYEFVSEGKFEINIVFPGALESLLYLGKHMDK